MTGGILIIQNAEMISATLLCQLSCLRWYVEASYFIVHVHKNQ